LSDDAEPLVFEPLLERDGVRVSRSPWGPDDEIGRLNWITPESRAEILGRLNGHGLFDLSVDSRRLRGPRGRSFVGATSSSSGWGG
jgi:hypothetical protein